MIPKKLELSNFTSYGANVPTLDFTSFHLAAVAGPNGAGKSSLLDAITWALWGTSRMGDAADPLIHTNATNMRVAFTFELDEKEYMVERTRTKKGAGSTTLALWAKHTNLTEGTIRHTQEKIIELLRMTYEVFTNSSYLRQGHADEFTMKGPIDRKRILADILGLSHYDRLEEKAKKVARECANRSESLDFHLTEIEAELAQKEQQEQVLSAAQTQLKQAEQSLSTTKKALHTLRAKKEAGVQEQTVIETSITRAREMQTEYTQTQQIIQKKQLEQEHLRHIVGRKSEIQSTLKELAEKQKLLDAARTQQDSLSRRKEEMHALELFIEQKERARASKLGALDGQRQTIDHELADLGQKISHLQTHKKSCPTCGQIIDAAKNKELLQQYAQRAKLLESEKKKIIQDYNIVKSFVLSQVKTASSQRREIEQQQKNIPDPLTLQREISTLQSAQKDALELARAGATIDEIQKTVQELTKKTTELSFVLRSMAALPQKKEAIEGRLTMLTEEEEALVRTEQAQEERVAQSRQSLGAAQQLKERSVQLAELREKKLREKSLADNEIRIYNELALAFGKRGIQAMLIETAIPEIELETNSLLDKLSDGRMHLSLSTQREKKTAKKGEEDVVETLDITIADEFGERPYDLYSGGEAFRVNFALRLAISKLLTTRAGAKLQFLIIDEGFGTQDVEGRERLIGAINAIREDFEKILVITHIDELKDAFPVRIDVHKVSGESTFTLLQ